ncbi:tape measure protein [Pseudochrobactrum sp. MP213Fo]|uniref:tape measure protein n=1 Tax=Pseudochrobactrum sp. MP213Fo TaxID=3022250 RepID=UPI003BA2480E
MDGIAYLGLGIKTDPIKEATDALDGFKKAAGGAESAAQGLAKGAGSVEKAANSLTSKLKNLAALAGIAFSVKGVIDMADSWSDLNSRVALAAGSIEKGAAVMTRLDDVAKRTYSSIKQTTEAYISNATSLRALGYSTSQTLDYTEALNNALVVAGAKGQAAESVTLALSKSMALGKLSGENLNTVIASGGRVAEALAKQLGVASTDLLAMGEAGKITGKVIYDSLTGELVTLREEAASMPATIGDAFTRIGSNLLVFIGSMDQLGNSSGWVAETLIGLADNIDRVVSYGSAAVLVYGTYVAGAFAIATVRTMSFAKALAGVKAAMLATGFGIAVVALGEFINLLVDARKNSESWGEAFQKVGQRLTLVWEAIKLGFQALSEYMEMIWNKMLAGVIRNTTTAMKKVLALFGVTESDLEANLAVFDMRADYLSRVAGDTASDAAKKLTEALAGFETAATGGPDLSKDAVKPTGAGIGTGKKAKKKTKSEGETASDKWAQQVQITKDQTEALRDQATAFGMTNFEAEKFTKTQDLLRAAKEAGIPITDAVKEQIAGLATEYSEAQLKLAGLQVELENRSPWEIMREELANLDEMLNKGVISWETYTQSVIKSRARAHGEIAGMAGDATSLLGQLFENNKAVAIADAIVSTYQGVAKSLATYPMPFAAAMAAGHLALGMKQVASIKSTNKKSTSVNSSSVSTTTPNMPAGGTDPTHAVNIQLKGDSFSKQSVVDLFETINEHIKDGGRIIRME